MAMATSTDDTKLDERRSGIPLRRLIIRTARLSMPMAIVLLGLVLSGYLRIEPAAIGIVTGLLLGGVLAFAREQRLVALEHRLQGLVTGSQQQSGRFDLLGGDALPVMTDQVERSLHRMRLRQAELDRTLSTLVDALPDPLLLVRGNRRVLRANVAATRLFEHDGTGKSIETVIRDPGFLAAVDDVLDGSDEAEVNLQLAGPPDRAFRGRIVPCRWHDQPAVLVSLRELTEQVAIERMRSDFVANASHELRTPLTVIRGFVETLSGPAKHDPAAQERFLKTMGAEAARMSRLVDDLLSLSRIEQNEHVTPDGRVSLADAIGAVVDALRPYAGDRRATLAVEMAPDLRPAIGDRDQLIQLFTNLIDNAIKYGGDNGRVVITGRFLECAPPGAGPFTGRPAVETVVQDHGEGIASEHLPRLTERFFRVDPALSRHLGGTGLGLAIVKHILRRHRGHIAFESEQGAGTKVTVYLPPAP